MDEQEKSHGDVAQIDGAISRFLDALAQNEVKLAVADVLRLLDLRKELGINEVREVRVRWVESNPAPFAINT